MNNELFTLTHVYKQDTLEWQTVVRISDKKNIKIMINDIIEFYTRNNAKMTKFVNENDMSFSFDIEDSNGDKSYFYTGIYELNELQL